MAVVNSIADRQEEMRGWRHLLHQRPETSYEEIMKVMKNASQNEMKNILGFTDEDVVSQDFIGDARTSIVDSKAGIQLNSKFYKIICWYDNEAGYSNKLIDLAIHSNG